MSNTLKLILESVALEEKYKVDDQELKKLKHSVKDINRAIRSKNISKIKQLIKPISSKYNLKEIDSLMSRKTNDYKSYKNKFEKKLSEKGEKYKKLAIPLAMMVEASKNKSNTYKKIDLYIENEDPNFLEILMTCLFLGAYFNLVFILESWIVPLIIIASFLILIDALKYAFSGNRSNVWSEGDNENYKMRKRCKIR